MSVGPKQIAVIINLGILFFNYWQWILKLSLCRKSLNFEINNEAQFNNCKILQLYHKL